MKTKLLLSLAIFFIAYIVNGQTVVCENASCTANDYTLDYFYLGDENGTPYSPGFCDLGVSLETHIWTNFITNSAADRYSLYIHFNVYINDVYTETVDGCYYEYESVPTDILMNLYTFNWGCGDQIVLKDFYMSWQPNASKGCGCNGAKCYQIPSIDVQGPLITNFEYSSSCSTPNTLDFISTTRGGVPPYIYSFLWDFGDGTTSTLEAPSHTYASTGPYNVSLTVNDTKDNDTHEVEIPSFDSNFPPEIYAPPSSNIMGCSIADIPLLPFRSSTVNITETEFNNAGGNIVLFNNLVSLTYTDVMSGTCPITITRTFTVVDSCNKSENATQTIEINDTELPTASNPNPINVQCALDIPAPNTNVVNNASDNCVTPAISWVSDVSDNKSCPETIIRTYRVSDDCGNSINVAQTIIINDDIAPTATNPEPIVVQCIEEVPSADINVITDEMDNCGIPQVSWVSDNTDDNSCPITITRTYSVTDSCDNSILLEQIITVDDTTPPAFVEALPADATVECDAVPTAETLTATDNCGTATVTFNEVRTDGDCPSSYSLARTWTATDECGLETVHTQTITVQDTTAPTFAEALPADATVECDAVPTAETLTASDNCGTATVTFNEVRTDGDCPSSYSLARTWTATDECGLETVHTQTITVQDTTAPTFVEALPADATVECDAVPTAGTLTATDNCGTATVTFNEVRTDGDCPSSYSLARTWTATDECGL
uniref:PKD domain-containing protein n=1 Tax=Tamlana flava TaxID=3158572 RepID=UPI00351AE571